MGAVGGRWAWGAATAAWLVAVTSGFGWLWRYAAAAGDPSVAPRSWPAASRLLRVADRAQLLMFVHPRCACSRASLDELGNLLRDRKSVV